MKYRTEDLPVDNLISLRYSRVAIWLHWIIATLIFVTIPLVLYGGSGKAALHESATNTHKLIGITILLLTIVRIIWRLTHRPPALPETMTRTLRYIARCTHMLFYLMLLAMPLSGWWMSSAFPRRHPIEAGLFDIPFLPVPVNMASAGAAHEIHEIGGWIGVTMIILHVAAALKHHFINRDGILSRMSIQ
ncbi:MAG: cytochrome b [Sphingorhabdus sp.]